MTSSRLNGKNFNKSARINRLNFKNIKVNSKKLKFVSCASLVNKIREQVTILFVQLILVKSKTYKWTIVLKNSPYLMQKSIKIPRLLLTIKIYWSGGAILKHNQDSSKNPNPILITKDQLSKRFKTPPNTLTQALPRKELFMKNYIEIT